MADFSVVALITAHNEADVIEHVVRDLIDQGVQIYFMDDGSTDRTLAIVERYTGRGVIGLERLSETLPDHAPDRFEWARILVRKARVAAGLHADWFIHHDADEFRESPWAGMALRDAIQRVDALGYNAIDAAALDFMPDHDAFVPGTDVREAFQFYAPAAPYDRVQVRCWKQTPAPVDLASSGGHDVQFPDRKVFPLRFILRHYPIRGQAQGARKIGRERRDRFLTEERQRGWHVQYDTVTGSFIRDRSTLTEYDADHVRLSLTLRNRDVDILETTLADVRAVLDQRTVERDESWRDLLRHRHEVGVLRDAAVRHAAEVAGLRSALADREAERDALRTALEHRDAELNAVRRSYSWRLMAPARAVYRLVTGR